MPRDYEQALICNHSVRIGDQLYSGPSETRAWVRGWRAEDACRQTGAPPAQRADLASHGTGAGPLWFRIGSSDR
jgi:hypothetical protein